MIDEWPAKIAEIRAITDLPIWVSEVGISSFGAEEVQEFGLKRTAVLLLPQIDRIYWYSLFDLPRAWPATTRHREAEGSSYYRHFYMGLLREDGTPKLALQRFRQHAPALGICQWFHFEDPRLDDAVRWLHELGVRQLRTGLSWADWLRPGAEAWFDRVMRALEPFDVRHEEIVADELHAVAERRGQLLPPVPLEKVGCRKPDAPRLGAFRRLHVELPYDCWYRPMEKEVP